MNVIPLHQHPLVRAACASNSAQRIATRMGLSRADAEHVARKTRALVLSGCSAAWAIATARRFARRAAREAGVVA